MFDIGLNNGDDTADYLHLGYRVIGVEANRLLVAACKGRFENEIRQGRVTIINAGLSKDDSRDSQADGQDWSQNLFLNIKFSCLRKYGFKDIILIVGYKAEAITGYFQDGKKWGVNIEYFVEDKPLGTTGGLKEIENKLTSDFILSHGDVMSGHLAYPAISDFHKSRKGIATLVIHPNYHPYDSDLVQQTAKGV